MNMNVEGRVSMVDAPEPSLAGVAANLGQQIVDGHRTRRRAGLARFRIRFAKWALVPQQRGRTPHHFLPSLLRDLELPRDAGRHQLPARRMLPQKHEYLLALDEDGHVGDLIQRVTDAPSRCGDHDLPFCRPLYTLAYTNTDFRQHLEL